jgi:type IV pilus assembly protein PilA
MLEFFHKRMKDDRGFTLIELMVVVLIIAILIAIAIPTFLGLRRRAQDRAAQSNLRNGLTAGKAFYTDDETYVGFTAASGEPQAIEPSLTWVDGNPANAGEVGITLPATVPVGQGLVLNAVSASTTQFCIADSSTQGTVRGSGGFAATYAACDALADW